LTHKAEIPRAKTDPLKHLTGDDLSEACEQFVSSDSIADADALASVMMASLLDKQHNAGLTIDPEDEKLLTIVWLCQTFPSAKGVVAQHLVHTVSTRAAMVAGALLEHRCLSLAEMMAAVVLQRLSLPSAVRRFSIL
jgi:hypothetical protein